MFCRNCCQIDMNLNASNDIYFLFFSEWLCCAPILDFQKTAILISHRSVIFLTIIVLCLKNYKFLSRNPAERVLF